MNSAVLITGASRGLGRALSEALARKGNRVVMVARGREALQTAAAELRAAGLVVHALVADVAEADASEALVGQAQALVGPIDILVNNASDLGPTPLPLLADMLPKYMSRIFEVNLMAPFRLTRALLGQMLLRGKGLVINISSDAAVDAYPGWGGYSASKAALDQLSRVWSAELEGSGVNVVAIDPGEMDTAMHAAAMPDADPTVLVKPETVASTIANHIQKGTLTTVHLADPRVSIAVLKGAA